MELLIDREELKEVLMGYMSLKKVISRIENNEGFDMGYRVELQLLFGNDVIDSVELEEIRE